MFGSAADIPAFVPITQKNNGGRDGALAVGKNKGGDGLIKTHDYSEFSNGSAHFNSMESATNITIYFKS
jgi:hypothetical protein